jgi:predicted ferric reductase
MTVRADTRAAPPAPTAPRRAGPAFRLSGRATLILVAVLAIVAVYATDQIAPATSDRQAQLRIWLAARAGGIVAFLLLTFQVCLGLILSHPTNKSTWKLSKRIFPWHEHLWVFVLAFLLVHIASIVLDPYAKVSPLGAILPGLSEYRSSAVAIGTMAVYAFLITALSARYTRLLPSGVWLKIHRLSLVVWVLAWLHSVLAGTDTDVLRAMYVVTGLALVLSGAYRYWASRQRRPTFTTSLPEGPAR